jgi:hypothetical protein
MSNPAQTLPPAAPAAAAVTGPPVYAYANQRVVRPPLTKAQRNRAFLAGAVSNTLLTAGLTIVTLSALFAIYAALFAFAAELGDEQSAPTRSMFASVLRSLGLSPDQAWVVWVWFLVAMLIGAALACAGIWIGRLMLATTDIDRPWAVTWSASGILVGTGLLSSTVVSPAAVPFATILIAAFAANGVGGWGMGLVLALMIVAWIASVVIYAVAGSLAWWWMAHALRRSA